MKCFIHNDVDAQGVCLKCGRAMCKNCMKFAKYSTVCPKCRRKILRKRAINCSVQIAILTGILYLIEKYYFDIFHLIDEEKYLLIAKYIFFGWGAIALIVLIITIANLIIIRNSEKKAKATLFSQKTRD